MLPQAVLYEQDVGYVNVFGRAAIPRFSSLRIRTGEHGAAKITAAAFGLIWEDCHEQTNH